MIFCVWYPSGGFGHFVNAILTLHGDNFARPKKLLKFSSGGDSHSLDLVVPKYSRGQWPGKIKFLEDKNYCVLIDNGITNESNEFLEIFPDSVVVKICYSNDSWPIIARTMIEKPLPNSIERHLTLDGWDSNEDWARREKYFLFLRDNHLRHAWKQSFTSTLYVDDLLDYKRLFDTLNSITKIEPFEDLWNQWRNANAKYIDPIKIAQEIVVQVKQKNCLDLTAIRDTWTQSVIYYYIWLYFGIEVPHNDFANFFTNTEQIIDLVS